MVQRTRRRAEGLGVVECNSIVNGVLCAGQTQLECTVLIGIVYVVAIIFGFIGLDDADGSFVGKGNNAFMDILAP